MPRYRPAHPPAQHYFGPGSGPHRTVVSASRDGGLTWQERAVVPQQYWSTLFTHGGARAGRLLKHPAGSELGQPPCLRPSSAAPSTSPPSFTQHTPICTPCRPAGAVHLLGTDGDDYGAPNAVSVARSTDGGATWNRSAVLPAPPGCRFASGAGGR